MVDMARFLVGFFLEESCGKCVPCREGTKQMLRILTRICEGRAAAGRPGQLLERLARTVQLGGGVRDGWHGAQRRADHAWRISATSSKPHCFATALSAGVCRSLCPSDSGGERVSGRQRGKA